MNEWGEEWVHYIWLFYSRADCSLPPSFVPWLGLCSWSTHWVGFGWQSLSQMLVPTDSPVTRSEVIGLDWIQFRFFRVWAHWVDLRMDWIALKLKYGCFQGSFLGLEVEDRLLRLESDKDSLQIQASLLSDQIHSQSNKIQDLEKILLDKKTILESTQDILSRVLVFCWVLHLLLPLLKCIGKRIIYVVVFVSS